MELSAPFLQYDALGRKAEAFLQQYHPDRTLPVPIEVIVERDFGMDIVPMPGLQEAFDTVAFITRDLTEIRVDQYVLQWRPNRYRFSLAHELGHRILHADVFRELDFRNIESWKEVVMSIPEREYGFLEFHANSFAGLVCASGGVTAGLPADRRQSKHRGL